MIEDSTDREDNDHRKDLNLNFLYEWESWIYLTDWLAQEFSRHYRMKSEVMKLAIREPIAEASTIQWIFL